MEYKDLARLYIYLLREYYGKTAIPVAWHPGEAPSIVDTCGVYLVPAYNPVYRYSGDDPRDLVRVSSDGQPQGGRINYYDGVRFYESEKGQAVYHIQNYYYIANLCSFAEPIGVEELI